LHGLHQIQHNLTRRDTGGVIITPNRRGLEFESASTVARCFNGPLDVLVGRLLQENVIRLGEGLNESLGPVVAIKGYAKNFDHFSFCLWDGERELWQSFFT